MSPIITLLTDFGTADGFVGTMKGVILGINPRGVIVDISHGIPKWNVRAAALVLDGACWFFPPGTVHVVVVDPGVGSDRAILAVEAGKHLFLAPDNGVLSRIFEREPDHTVFRVTNRSLFLPVVSSTFHGRDVFAPVAARLSRDTPVSAVGEPFRDPVTGLIPRPLVTDADITGEVIYVDDFGNVITNIGAAELEGCVRPATVHITIKGKILKGLRTTYAAGGPGELIALVSSGGYLEIACNRGSAAAVLDARPGNRVAVSQRENPPA